jgi:glutamine cyclotransferase
VTITDGSKSVRWLNEIEYINGEVWGMIWQTECIARVDPKDGSVIGWLLMDVCDSARSQHGTQRPSLLSSTRDHDRACCG